MLRTGRLESGFGRGGGWGGSLFQAGQWTVRLSEPARVSITSRPSRSGPVAKLRAFLGNGVLERAAVHVPPAVLHAELMRGARPLHGAQVMASVRTPRGVEVRIPLRDDGAGTDVTAGDGVYSAAFITLDVAGRYAVQVRARGRSRSRKPAVSSDFLMPAHCGWEPSMATLPTPLQRLRDLSVEGVSRTGHGWLITLAWTAPGDQVDQGTDQGTILADFNEMIADHVIDDAEYDKESTEALQYHDNIRNMMSRVRYLLNSASRPAESTAPVIATATEPKESLLKEVLDHHCELPN
ncbi:hypothetical protein MRX96_027983 [Rhipicephalus microplus]